MPAILVGTKGGLLRFGSGGGEPHRELEGRAVDAIAPAAWKTLWAAVDGTDIWRLEGGSAPGWTRVASLDGLGGSGLQSRCLADTRANHENGILVGTSGAHLVRVGGEEPGLVAAFEAAPGRDSWYTPWGGPPDVRSITEDRAAVYVNVHVGGVLRSRDGGGSWEPTIDIDADVHRVVTGAGRVYAAGARGLSVSEDQGATWKLSARGLHASYCRSVAVAGATVLVSASDGPWSGRAAVYRTDREGVSFERARAGLPEWFEGNIDSLCLDALPDGRLSAFGSESGELFTSTDQGITWTRLAQELGEINCVLVWP